MNERVAVVIPYFQREPGLLSRALRSVFQQREPIDPLVIVVDDSSPLPADVEISTLDPAQRRAIRLIRQPNAGAGCARNTALDAVADDVSYVALMDPDDVWAEDHLEQAMAAMHLGYDFYFCDQRIEGDQTGIFADRGLDPADHIQLMPHYDLYAFTGDFFGKSLVHAFVPTSTAVLRRSRLGHLRFCDRLRPVGEDLLFWLDVSRATKKIAFSARASLIYGEGVSGSWARDWASVKSLFIINGYANYYDEVRRRFALTPDQTRLVQDRIRQTQWDFAGTLIGMIRRGLWPDAGLVGRFLVRNPKVVAITPMVLVALLTRRKSWAGAPR